MQGGDPQQWMPSYASPDMYNKDQMYQGQWDYFAPSQQDNFYQGGYDQQFIPDMNEMFYPPQSDMLYPQMQYNQMQINPINFDTNLQNGRFFVIKSYSEDDIHKSIKYNVWSSTKDGNIKLNTAYQESQGKWPIYLFFSVNASGQFVGVAQMKSVVDYTKSFGDWAQQGKWMGQFDVQWIYVKDVPNKEFRSITLENNEGKPVTNSRDTQEVPLKQACLMLNIIKNYKSKTSILDDFEFYDKRQNEMDQNKQMMSQEGVQQNPEDLLTTQIKNSQLNPKSSEFHFKGTIKQKQPEQT